MTNISTVNEKEARRKITWIRIIYFVLMCCIFGMIYLIMGDIGSVITFIRIIYASKYTVLVGVLCICCLLFGIMYLFYLEISSGDTDNNGRRVGLGILNFVQNVWDRENYRKNWLGIVLIGSLILVTIRDTYYRDYRGYGVIFILFIALPISYLETDIIKSEDKYNRLWFIYCITIVYWFNEFSSSIKQKVFNYTYCFILFGWMFYNKRALSEAGGRLQKQKWGESLNLLKMVKSEKLEDMKIISSVLFGLIICLIILQRRFDSDDRMVNILLNVFLLIGLIYPLTLGMYKDGHNPLETVSVFWWNFVEEKYELIPKRDEYVNHDNHDSRIALIRQMGIVIIPLCASVLIKQVNALIIFKIMYFAVFCYIWIQFLLKRAMGITSTISESTTTQDKYLRGILSRSGEGEDVN